MYDRLSGKTILITGASSGIGRSTAFGFAAACPKNLKIILAARRVDRLDQIARHIHEKYRNGVSVLPVQLDVASPAEVQRFIPSLPPEYRDIDILVNNAGFASTVAHAGSVKEEDINSMFATNVTGLINVTQAVLPSMKQRNRGDIIMLGSVAGREGYPGGTIYCATKSAVRSFTDAMRRELIDTRVRVMSVDPGRVETEFTVIRMGGDKAKADAVYAGSEPLTPDDVAEVIVFAASRRENVVVADTIVFPNHQASAMVFHKTI